MPVLVAPLAILMGFACNGADTRAEASSNESTLYTAAQKESSGCTASATDGCAFAWTDAATMVVMISVIIRALVAPIVLTVSVSLVLTVVALIIAVLLGDHGLDCRQQEWGCKQSSVQISLRHGISFQ